MSRSLTPTTIQDLGRASSLHIYSTLLKIDHEDLATPILAVNDIVDRAWSWLASGATWYAFPFQINLPGDYEDQMPDVTLTIENVSRQIVDAVRTISSPATLELSLISSAATAGMGLDLGPIQMTIRSVEYNAMTVTATIQPEDILTEPYPGDIFSPANYPGLF